MKLPKEELIVKEGKVSLPKDFILLTELWIGGKDKLPDYITLMQEGFDLLSFPPKLKFMVHEDSIYFTSDIKDGTKVTIEYINVKIYKREKLE